MSAFPQSPNASIIAALMRAYNEHDVDVFSRLFAPDVHVYEHPGMLVQKGRRAVYAHYSKRFVELPELKADVLHRIVINDYVIDHERIQRSQDQAPFEVVTVYLIKDNEIQRMDTIRQDQLSLNTNITSVVDALVKAYNAHNAVAFAGLFSEDANAYEYPNELAQKGRHGIEKHYTRRFAELPELHTQVIHRIVLGNYVIDHERVQRAHNQAAFETLAINHVIDGTIQRLDIIR